MSNNPAKQAIVAGGVRAMGDKELKGCPVCGSQIVTIRGKYPSEPKRQVCPTCLKERMDVIHDMSDPAYGWLVVQNRQYPDKLSFEIAQPGTAERAK